MDRNSDTCEFRKFVTSDGTKLGYTIWHPGSSGRVSRIVAILPGMGYHSEPYKIVPQSMNLSETIFVGLDYRGHGRSEGIRGRLASPGRISLDVQEWLVEIDDLAPESKLFLLGESMGGPYALLTAMRISSSLAGLIFIAPAIMTSRHALWNIESLRILSQLVWDPFSLSIDLSGGRLTSGSRDPEFIENKRNDRLALREVSPAYVLRIGQAIARALLRPRIRVECPVFIAHGESDRILSPVGSRVLHFRINCPDKQLVMFPQAYHTLFWDPVSPQLFAQLTDWIQSQA